MSKQENKSNQSGGLQLVIERNSFYNDGYNKLKFLLVMIILLGGILAATIGYKIMNPTQPEYFAATPNGRILQIYPLSKPVETDSFVLQWTANQVRLAFALDYMHWHQQLQEISGSFTPLGWNSFVSSLKKSNNLSTLEAKKMVSNAEITGAPQVQQKAVVNGHFTWKIKLPILVTYSNLNGGIPMPMDITIIVMRMPVQNYPQRLAINNFLPILESSSQGFTTND